MKDRSIIQRWLRNVASIMLVIIIAVSILIFMFLRSYYYGAARMTVEELSPSKMSSLFGLYGASNTGFEDAARDYVENFSNKDKLALWVINSEGKVIVSSNGFSINDKVEMPDYDAALSSGSGTADWIGRLPSGEKIMAYTCAYHYSSGEYGGAIRYMVSLDAIDEQLNYLAILIVCVALFMFAALIFTGMLFIRSIVNPVKAIGETAKRIAGGDFSTGIEAYKYKDEIGELCDTINDMAQQLSETDNMKNEFISTVSHELRTPLTAIRGWGETLQQIGDSDPDTTKRGMEIIISEATRLNEMVEELLDFSRMSSGGLKLNKEKIDYLAELDEVVFTLRDRIIREGIEFNYNVPTLPAPGFGDADRIKQVFINIIDNAIKYTEQGGVIGLLAEIPDPTQLIITVYDTGCGISAEDLPHIREKFYKANTTVRGSGIGLAVCDEIMSLHDGRMDIDSVQGQGTTVKLLLPLNNMPESEGKENT